MEEAGRTCIISRRWKDIWTFTPHFNFDFSKRFWRIMKHVDSIEQDEQDEGNVIMNVLDSERKQYIKWVNQLVENHQGTDISELVIVFPLDERDSCHLDKWIEFALRKRVREVKIDLFPWFASEDAEAYSFTRNAPAISGIECLTSLSLKRVNIPGEMIEQFLFVCPLLERLSLIDCEHISNLRIVGSSLKLKYLNIEFGSPLESIHICVPNLESFHYRRLRGTTTKLRVENLCRLVDLQVAAADIGYELTEFSSYFLQLETFAMDFDYNEVCLEQLRLSRFTKLRHLIFRITDPEFYMYGLYEFIHLSCPCLEKFTIEISQLGYEQEVSVIWPDKGLQHQCLKVVEITTFVGKSHEIKLAECFLKTGINLEKLIVDTRCRYSLMFYPDDRQHDEYRAGSRKQAENLRKMLPVRVELLIL